MSKLVSAFYGRFYYPEKDQSVKIKAWWNKDLAQKLVWGVHSFPKSEVNEKATTAGPHQSVCLLTFLGVSCVSVKK